MILEYKDFTKELVSSQRTLVKTLAKNAKIMTHSQSTSACLPISEPLQNNHQQQEPRVNFGWKEVEPGKQSLPYINRGLECLVAVLIFKKYLLLDMAKPFSTDILTCIRWRRYYMSESEADAFNEINYQHCNGNLVAKHIFQKGELMMSLVDVTRIVIFFKTCCAALFLRKYKNNLFGFIRIANQTDVLFIWDNGRQLVPLFYFEDQTEYLHSKSTLLTDPWKLGYLEFCCKVQKIREIYYANPKIRVVDFVYVKKLFRPDVTFELSWPDKPNEDLLAAGAQLSTLNGTPSAYSVTNGVMGDATNQAATQSGDILGNTSSKLPGLQEQISQISASNANYARFNVESTLKTTSSVSVYRTDVATKQCLPIEVSNISKDILQTNQCTKRMKTLEQTENKGNQGAVNKTLFNFQSTQVAQYNNCKDMAPISSNSQHYIHQLTNFNPVPTVPGHSLETVPTTWTPRPCCPRVCHNQTENTANMCVRKENNYTIIQFPSSINFAITQSNNRHSHITEIYSAAPKQSPFVDLRPALKHFILRHASLRVLDQETLTRFFFSEQKATLSVNEIHEVAKEIQRFCNDRQSWLQENDVSHTSAQTIRNQPATLNLTNTTQIVHRTDVSANNCNLLRNCDNHECNAKYLAGIKHKTQVVEHLDLDWPPDKSIYSLKHIVIKGYYFLGIQLSPVMNEFLVNFYQFAKCLLPLNSSSQLYRHLLDQFKCIYYLNEQQKAIWREAIKSGVVKDFGCVFVLHSEIVRNFLN